MNITDPIADLLTRIRNGLTAKKEFVVVPASKMKVAIANILEKEGYVSKVELTDEGVQGTIKITLKYGKNNQKVVTGLKRVSKPGLRVYAECDRIPKVLNGMGIAILSTSNGVITDREARAKHVGGEVLAYIW